MVRLKSWVRSTGHFVRQANGRMLCVYCRKIYQDNATHLQNHLLEKDGCSSIPGPLRTQLVSKHMKCKSSAKRRTHTPRREQATTSRAGSAVDNSDADTSESESENESSLDSEDEEIRSQSRTSSAGSNSTLDRSRSPLSRNSSRNSGQGSSSSIRGPTPGVSSCGTGTRGQKPNPILDMHQRNTSQNEEITQCLVQAIIATASPLSFVESEHWIKLFKKLKPSYTMPTRYELANRLLKQEFDRVNAEVERLIAEARSLVLELDGWGNRRREPIINMVINTPLPLFYESLSTHEMSHTATNMFTLADGVITKIGAGKFLGVVTDSASNMVRMKVMLHQKYPHISVWPCSAHLLHNLTKDIFSGKVLNELLTDFKFVVNEVNGKLLRVIFRQIQVDTRPENQPRALNSPADTRFGGHVLLLDSVATTKDSLLELAKYRHEESNNIKLSDDSANTLNRRGIWTLLESALKMTRPILQWVTRLEGDTSCLGETVEAFYHIEQNIETCLPQLKLENREAEKIRSKLQSRRKNGLTPIHFLANMLDARFQGVSLSKEEIQAGINQLISLCDLIPRFTVNKDAILIAFANLRQCTGEFIDLKTITRESPCNTLWPDVWWSTFHLTSDLCELAIEVTMLTPTSSATERVNSCYDSVHTKKRNRLVTERAGMLTFCKHNYRLLEAVNRKRPSAKTLPSLYSKFVVLAEEDIFEESDFDLSGAELSEEEPEEELEVFEGHTPESVKSAEEALRYLFGD